MTEHPMMKCGCVAQAVESGTGRECCIVHDCLEVETELPNLMGRMAKCDYCNKLEPSDMKLLPFFKYCPDSPYDRYYCGCRGFE